MTTEEATSRDARPRRRTGPLLVRATWLLALPLAWLLLHVDGARADRGDPLERTGCAFVHAGLGPVIGWSFGPDTRGYRLFGGFELSGGCPWARLSIGGMYRRSAPGEPREKAHWVALDPGLLIGPSIGFMHSTETGAQGIVGGWVGGAVPVAGELKQRPGHGPISSVCTSLSVVLRVRFTGAVRRTDLFLSPKAQYCVHPDFAT